METTRTAQSSKAYYFEVPFDVKNVRATMDSAREDAEECAALNPGSTVAWIWHSSFYWHGAYVVKVAA